MSRTATEGATREKSRAEIALDEMLEIEAQVRSLDEAQKERAIINIYKRIILEIRHNLDAQNKLTEDEFHREYKKRILFMHPDRQNGEDRILAEKHFKFIQNADEELKANLYREAEVPEPPYVLERNLFENFQVISRNLLRIINPDRAHIPFENGNAGSYVRIGAAHPHKTDNNLLYSEAGDLLQALNFISQYIDSTVDSRALRVGGKLEEVAFRFDRIGGSEEAYSCVYDKYVQHANVTCKPKRIADFLTVADRDPTVTAQAIEQYQTLRKFYDFIKNEFLKSHFDIDPDHVDVQFVIKDKKPCLQFSAKQYGSRGYEKFDLASCQQVGEIAGNLRPMIGDVNVQNDQFIISADIIEKFYKSNKQTVDLALANQQKKKSQQDAIAKFYRAIINNGSIREIDGLLQDLGTRNVKAHEISQAVLLACQHCDFAMVKFLYDKIQPNIKQTTDYIFGKNALHLIFNRNLAGLPDKEFEEKFKIIGFLLEKDPTLFFQDELKPSMRRAAKSAFDEFKTFHDSARKERLVQLVEPYLQRRDAAAAAPEQVMDEAGYKRQVKQFLSLAGFADVDLERAEKVEFVDDFGDKGNVTLDLKAITFQRKGQTQHSQVDIDPGEGHLEMIMQDSTSLANVREVIIDGQKIEKGSAKETASAAAVAIASVAPQTQQAFSGDDEIATQIAIEISAIEEEIRQIESQQFFDQTDSAVIDALRASQKLQLESLREKSELLQSMASTTENVYDKISNDLRSIGRLIEGKQGFYKRKIIDSRKEQDAIEIAEIRHGTAQDTFERIDNAMMTNEEVARSLDAVLERDKKIAVIGRTQAGQTGNLQDVIDIINNCFDQIKDKDALVFANLDRVHFASVVVDLKNGRIIVADSLTENIDERQYGALLKALEKKTGEVFTIISKLREQRLQQHGDLSCAMQSFLNVLFTIQEIKRFNGASLDVTDDNARRFAQYLFGHEIDERAKLSQGTLIPYLQEIYDGLGPTQKLDVDRRVLLLANINKHFHEARPIDRNLLMATPFDNSVKIALTTIKKAMEDDIAARTPQGASWTQTPKHPGTNKIGKLAVAIDRRDRFVAALQAQTSISNSVDVSNLEKMINELNEQIASSEIYQEFMATAKSRQSQTQNELRANDARVSDDTISAATSQKIITQFFRNHPEFSDLAKVVGAETGTNLGQQNGNGAAAADSSVSRKEASPVQPQQQVQSQSQQQQQPQSIPQLSLQRQQAAVSPLEKIFTQLREFKHAREENFDPHGVACLIYDPAKAVKYGVLAKPDGSYVKIRQFDGKNARDFDIADEEFLKILEILKTRATRSAARYEIFNGLPENQDEYGSYKTFAHNQHQYRIYQNGYIMQELPRAMKMDIEYEKEEYLSVIKAARAHCQQSAQQVQQPQRAPSAAPQILSGRAVADRAQVGMPAFPSGS